MEDAADFFVVAFRNKRAETIGTLVNLYEAESHRRRVEADQQEMIGQQRIGNMLQLGNLMVQGQQASEQQAARNRRQCSLHRIICRSDSIICCPNRRCCEPYGA